MSLRTVPAATRALAPVDAAAVDVEQRTVEGVVCPYSEVSHLTPHRGGERVLPGAFAASVQGAAAQRVLLYRDHDHKHPIGKAVRFTETPDGLIGSFKIRTGQVGDETLADLREEYLPAFSVGFRTLRTKLAADGVLEVVQAQLLEVSLVSLPAYAGAKVLAVRRREPIPDPWADVDLSPVRLPGQAPSWFTNLHRTDPVLARRYATQYLRTSR